MKITIDYEASWRNSFLEGSNNEELPKTGRKFIGSMTNLKKADNFIQRDVSLDTVMGILNRLIGDQRKLYQARNDENYYFKDIEPLVTYKDIPSYINNEMTYIRNINNSFDKTSYTGMIMTNDPIFKSDYSCELWGVLNLDIEELCDFITSDYLIVEKFKADPLSITSRFKEIEKIKPIENTLKAKSAFVILSSKFEKYKGLNNKGLLIVMRLYCSALYLQLERLSAKYDLGTATTKAGRISGISNNGFTPKDFMNRFTTGDKKRIWGNPYIRKEKIKGIGEVSSIMTKASGTLEIELAIDRKKGKELRDMINNAGVSSFYLGKKGLAYVSKLRV